METLVTGPFDEEALADMQRRGFDPIRLGSNASTEELKSAIATADAYIQGGNERISRELIDAAPHLRIIVFLGEQPETYLAEGTKELLSSRGIVLESTPGTSTNAVAEMTCALILSALRRVPFLVEQVRDHAWPEFTGGELTGKILGIYGMGKIGYTVAQRLFGFDLERILYSDIVRSERAEEDFGAERVELPVLFEQSDIISIHAPLNDMTRCIIDYDLLKRMKPTASIVNAARAWIVDPADLRRALTENRLCCAAFDGYYVEGRELMDLVPGEDPFGLLSMHNRFFATSHQAFNTREALKTSSQMALDKLIEFFAKSRKRAA